MGWWCLVSPHRNLIGAFDLVHFLFKSTATPSGLRSGINLRRGYSCAPHVGGLIASLRSGHGCEGLIHPDRLRQPSEGSKLHEHTGVLQQTVITRFFLFCFSFKRKGMMRRRKMPLGGLDVTTCALLWFCHSLGALLQQPNKPRYII